MPRQAEHLGNWLLPRSLPFVELIEFVLPQHPFNVKLKNGLTSISMKNAPLMHACGSLLSKPAELWN